MKKPLIRKRVAAPNTEAIIARTKLEKYLENHGMQCPQCESYAKDYEPQTLRVDWTDPAGPCIRGKGYCDTCGCRWEDVFTLARMLITTPRRSQSDV
jgi:C4-type Zn-finger protein